MSNNLQSEHILHLVGCQVVQKHYPGQAKDILLDRCDHEVLHLPP